MLFTIIYRLCLFVGICNKYEALEVHPNVANLNSFSTKTAYRNSKLTELKDSDNDLRACQLVQVNSIFRHGTRFPSLKDIEKMSLLHKKFMKSRASSVLPESFQKWQSPFVAKSAKSLASVGYEEMMLIGRRFRALYSKIHGHGDPAKFTKIYSSSLSRSRLSASTFLTTFLETIKSPRDISRFIQTKDEWLRFFDNCPFYETNVLRNKMFKSEINQFSNGPEMLQVIKDIQLKWKLNDVKISSDDARTLFAMCGYEIATNLSSFMKPHHCPPSPAGDGLNICLHQTDKKDYLESSPLCSLFEQNHYNVLDYLYDLKHYWLKSYGTDINWLQSCALVSPLIQHIMDAARGYENARKSAQNSNRPLEDSVFLKENYMRAVFWFGHAETIIPIVTLLGLFNQSSHLTADSFHERLSLQKDEQRRFKMFKVANISPFSGNVGLNLYHCPHLAKDGISGYRVRVNVNEKHVPWPIARDKSHVSLELFLKHVHLCLPEKYDYDAICIRGLSQPDLHKLRRRSDEL